MKLLFVNNSRAMLSVRRPLLLPRRADPRPRLATSLRDGRFRLAPGERRTVALVPAPGRYRARSGNIPHRALGMSALIVVE